MAREVQPMLNPGREVASGLYPHQKVHLVVSDWLREKRRGGLCVSMRQQHTQRERVLAHLHAASASHL